MKKRKREVEDLPERAKPPELVANEEKSDDFLVHVLNVSEFVTSKSTPNDKQLASLDCILEALTEKKAMPGCPISENDVCLLLLPWAVRNLLSGTNHSCSIWHTLFVSMDVLVNSNDSHAKYSLSNQVMTQSTLFKLCPRVALFIASHEEDDDVSIGFEVGNAAKSYATKAYAILTEKLFHPTMDVACKSLLLVIVDKETQASSAYDMVLVATMNLIHRLVVHGKGNPKTTFQLFASAPVLIALSKVYCYFRSRNTIDADISGQAFLLLQKIFSVGLFHPAHHLQGFYSILHKTKVAPFSRDALVPHQNDKDSSFRCYQEELLVTVEQSLSKHDAECELHAETVSIIHGVSLLFQVFLEQKMEERGDTSSKKKSHALDPVNMQFQMFARWVVRLQHLVETSIESLRSAALQAILTMLESLLKHNAYSASQHDENGYFFNFLAGIYHQISATTSVTTRGTGNLGSIIPIFIVLLRLNHRLVHDSLERLITCSLEVGVHGNERQAADLLVEVFASYEKLRQQSYAVGAILKALTSLRSKGNDAETYLFLDLLGTEKVRAAASLAILSCPILLVKEIFSMFEEWFVLAISKKETGPPNGGVCFYVAVDVFEILCQSVIVDKTTASHIAEMCEHFMEHAVSSLSTLMAVTTGSLKSALADVSSSLCGGIIDLHIRCAFWLGRTNHLGIPALLSEHLSNFRYLKSSKSYQFAGMFYGVALLACNRLTQIDTEIHEEERKAIESEDKTSYMDSLVTEGKALASSIFTLGSHSNCDEPGQYRHPYYIIARHCFQWLKYAGDDHVSLFLRWVCKAAVVPMLDESQKPAPEISTFGKADLLLDSSFVGHNLICNRLFPAALAAAFDLLRLGLSTRENADRDGVSDLLFVLDQLNNGQSIASSLRHLQQKEITVMVDISDNQLLHLFRRSSYLLREVAAPSIDSCDPSNDGKKSLHILCKLDLAFRSLKFPSTLIIPEWTTTQFVMRKVLSKLLKPLLSESLRTCAETRQQALDTVERMFDSFATNDDYLNLTSDGTTVSCGLELLVSCIVGSLLESDSASDLATSLRNMTALATKRRDDLVLVVFSRFLAEGIRKYKICNEYPSREVTSYLDALWAVAKLHFKKDSLESSSYSRQLRIGCMLLGCDILRIERDETRYLELFEEIADDESIVQGEDAAIDYELQSRVYVIGFLALTCTERSRCKRLLNAIIQQKREHALLDAAYMNVLIHITVDDFDELLEKLIKREAPQVTLRYLLLSVQCATAEQTTAVAKHAQTIFTLTTNLLNSSFRSQDSLNTGLVLSLEIIDFLLNHRETIIFREFDIAVILSHLCAILGDCDQHTVSEVSVPTFSWCTTILTSMFQRYPKYLYACVPIVISLYFCLLKHAVFGPVDRKVSQQFAGVCELMVVHKEVYKKHVLGIVLEFVWQVGFLSLEHRNQMLPAIYSLLDTMSTYEMQQLNASIGTEQKVLFRTIYQSYQKGHTYKGQ